ncbi:hypothetical protein SAMN05421681_103214 [Lysobacter enzymogenes]|nr:hypothetical protein SAMN05421681_103214 [Lysobacter enzymogenes]
MSLTNPQLQQYDFLAEMQRDAYFPPHLVEKGRQILIRLCEAIEADRPQSLDALYVLSHAATEEFNRLAEEFYEHDSEIEPRRARTSVRISRRWPRLTVSIRRMSRN